jgi:hypothetical protein
VDASNDLVYLPTTIEGRLRVLERRSLRLAGVIDLGLGPRNAFVSSRAGALLAGTSRAYYYWKSADLARRFAPTGAP